MPAEQPFHVPPCILVPDRELDLLADSHFKLNCLDDTQELVYTSHPKLYFDYDEDTKSLVKESTLIKAVTLLSNSSDFAAGNTTIASKDCCYEIEADEP